MVTLELTAVHHYLLHAGMCDNWGYERLKHELHERTTDEIAHVSKVIDHMLYLEGLRTFRSSEQFSPARAFRTCSLPI